MRKKEKFNKKIEELVEIVEKTKVTIKNNNDMIVTPQNKHLVYISLDSFINFVDFIVDNIKGLKEQLMKEEGLRYNDNKLRVDLVTPQMTEALARILTFGCKKYEERNWEKGMK